MGRFSDFFKPVMSVRHFIKCPPYPHKMVKEPLGVVCTSYQTINASLVLCLNVVGLYRSLISSKLGGREGNKFA